MNSSDKERAPQLLFVKALASRGRLEAITQQMGYHPQYLDSFLRMQHYMLHMDGPLPFDCRHYIAVMVSGSGLSQQTLWRIAWASSWLGASPMALQS